MYFLLLKLCNTTHDWAFINLTFDPKSWVNSNLQFLPQYSISYTSNLEMTPCIWPLIIHFCTGFIMGSMGQIIVRFVLKVKGGEQNIHKILPCILWKVYAVYGYIYIYIYK